MIGFSHAGQTLVCDGVPLPAIAEAEGTPVYVYSAAVLRERTPPDSGFVAFGNGWSSTFAYYAQRKSFTVPVFFKDYNRAWSDPGHFLGDAPLGAMVVCPTPRGPSLQQAKDRVQSDAQWRLIEASNCYVMIKQ